MGKLLIGTSTQHNFYFSSDILVQTEENNSTVTESTSSNARTLNHSGDARLPKILHGKLQKPAGSAKINDASLEQIHDVAQTDPSASCVDEEGYLHGFHDASTNT